MQFAFTVSFHIIFPSFTIGLPAWLTTIEALYLIAGKPVYRVVFEFWLKIFGVAFGLGFASSIVMAFEFGTNWRESRACQARYRGRSSPMRVSRPSRSKAAFLAFFCSGDRALHHGSICSQRRWWRSAPRFTRSGSWSTIAGCRRRSSQSGETIFPSPVRMDSRLGPSGDALIVRTAARTGRRWLRLFRTWARIL